MPLTADEKIRRLGVAVGSLTQVLKAVVGESRDLNDDMRAILLKALTDAEGVQADLR